MKNKGILLSGVKPTGRPHLGNYFGVMKQLVDMQDTYEKVFVFIPDYHGIISVQDGDKLQQLTLGVAIDFLAIGLDPEKVYFYKQSDIPVHTELAWIFNCLTTMPQLMRGHAFKDSEAKSKEVSVGLFDYPILQAADIALYDATVIPVGQDQAQHIEMARDVIRKFNATYGETFVEPQAYIKKGLGIVLGSDGRKMSKSYDNYLGLFATEEETKKYIMGVAMDSKGINEKKNPDDYTLYNLSKLVTTPEQDLKIRADFENGGVGYGDIKKYVAEIFNDYFREMRERRKELEKNPEKILRILKSGGVKASKIANKKMKEAREKVGLEIY